MGLGEGQTTWWRLKSRTEGKRSAAHAVHCLFLGKMRVVLRTLMMEIKWKHLSIPTRIHAVIVFAWNILKSYRASVGVRMVHPQLVSSLLCSHPADPQSSSSIKIPCHWFLRNFRDATVASKHKGQEAQQEPYFQNFDQVLHIWSQYACWLAENKAGPWKLGTLNNISNSCRMSDSSLPTTGSPSSITRLASARGTWSDHPCT